MGWGMHASLCWGKTQSSGPGTVLEDPQLVWGLILMVRARKVSLLLEEGWDQLGPGSSSLSAAWCKGLQRRMRLQGVQDTGVGELGDGHGYCKTSWLHPDRKSNLP